MADRIHTRDLIVDLRTGEIYRNGELLELPPRAVEILSVLILRPGELVTRDEIRQAVWNGQQVDFDRSVNLYVSLLRKSFGDDARAPRYIETVPRRGYRFIAPVVSEPTRTERRFRPGPAVAGLAGLVAVAVVLLGPREATEDASLTLPQARPFTSLEGYESWPSFSPDGHQIAFVSDAGDDRYAHIFVKRVDGGEPLQLTGTEADDGAPAWSPDGNEIAFVRAGSSSPGDEGESSYEILAVPALGGRERVLGSTIGFGKPAWHPDGTHLVVEGTVASSRPAGLVLLSLHDGERRLLTRPPEDFVRDYNPAFSPDGTLLAFIRGPEASAGSGEIYVMPTDGGEAKRIIDGVRRLRGFDWTPDGRAIVYASILPGFETMLWKVFLSGGEPTLIKATEGAVYPSLASNRLAYTVTVRDLNVWRVPGPAVLERSPPEKLLASTRNDLLSEYSRDGTEIAFVSDRDGEVAIWIADAEGESLRKLDYGIRYGAPSWRPAGNAVAYGARTSSNGAGVFVMNARGGPRRLVTESLPFDGVPSWSPDGDWIYFQSLRSGSWEIWRIASEGGEARQITHGGGQFPRAARDRVYYWWDGAIRATGPEGGEEQIVLGEAGLGWTVWNEKIVYMNRKRAGDVRIELLDPASGEVSEIVRVGDVPRPFYGLSVSPDGAWILYTQDDHPGSDIMLVENLDW